MRLSIIVPTVNRQKSLRRAIESLQRQAASREQFEILIVNNGSADETRKLARELGGGAGERVRLLHEPRLGLHNARHAGARAAVGEILVFTDDDATFDPNWLGAYAEAFDSHPEMMAAGGPVRPVWEVSPPSWLRAFMGGATEFGMLSLMEPYKEFRLESRGYFFGVNMAIRREVIFEVGGFNPEAFGDIWFGDGETGLNRKLWDRAMLIGYVPDALVYHHIPPHRMTVEYLCRRMANEGACDMYARFHPEVPDTLLLCALAAKAAIRRLPSWIAASVLRGRTDVRSLQIQLDSARTQSQVKYIARLIRSQEFRDLVSKERWLNRESPVVTPPVGGAMAEAGLEGSRTGDDGSW